MACSPVGSPSVSWAPGWPPNPTSMGVDASPAHAGQLLTTYARAAHHPAFRGRLDAHLTALCVHHHDTLTLPAIEVATQVEAPAPLIDALRQLTTNPATPNELLITMADRLPLAIHNLAEWATELTGYVGCGCLTKPPTSPRNPRCGTSRANARSAPRPARTSGNVAHVEKQRHAARPRRHPRRGDRQGTEQCVEVAVIFHAMCSGVSSDRPLITSWSRRMVITSSAVSSAG